MLNVYKKALCLVLLATLNIVINAQSCQPVGGQSVFIDESCLQGGPGCNAGGQGQTCRFCGFDIFPPCPSTATTTQPTTTPSTTRTTTPTTTTTKTTTTPTTTKSTTTAPIVTDENGSTITTTTTTPDPNATTRPPVVVRPDDDEENDDTPGALIFSDEFDTLDFKVWKHDMTMSGGGNWEFQLYHNNRTNSFIKDGVLHIKPTLTADRIGEDNLKSNYRMDMWGGSPADLCTGNNFYGCERYAGAGGNVINPIQSAKITTVESFSFKYGRFECRAKLPKGDWLWPAIWLLPVHNIYGQWPASGEIDVMEGRGNANYPHSAGGGIDSFGSTLHWGADWSQNRFDLTHVDYHHTAPLSDEFHTYGLYWTEDRLFTYIDDESNKILDVDLTQDFWEKGKFPGSYNNPWEGAENGAPFNHEYYIIINLAVGGTAGYFPDGVGGKPWNSQSSNAVNEFYAAKNSWLPTWNNPDVDFEIDSVKVWSLD